MEPISLAVGAILLIFGGISGFIAGRRGRSNVVSANAVCEGCAHGLSYHDGNGRCQLAIEREHYVDGGFDGYEHVQCDCRQYVGPIPADRMLASFPMPPSLIDPSDR